MQVEDLLLGRWIVCRSGDFVTRHRAMCSRLAECHSRHYNRR